MDDVVDKDIHSTIGDGRQANAIGRAHVNGTLESTRLGEGVVPGIILLWMALWSHAEHHAISLAKSVTSSQIAHHVGGFGEPPKVSLNDT